MSASKILSIISLVIAGLVASAEVNYYLLHPYRAGVAPHIIGLGVAIVLLAVSHFLKCERK